ncbi:hypothetical protein TVAG_286390 [Trichomonas vaginalis G3]|uniref:Uncharacterized protein n=1 Tax=Trichomonas vaginalis (strain ATCC PRA-98 / G3) TaxID=412133 RepID=A2EPF3_TRIV3|nr:hypothetical protein TVAGG3_0616170 [Trichomonas vaginalis G3]EAY05461.1 hypothetical protein TVAG_286390 [Trichomonas vaginalis G3]KAI5503561.1 hypothetical protein TVAGG3_0616170 [Trichomonas vaginalis G3]|eukprot:XP_001317684.1 hypothetical protein [Trichomonas vaginalis G3]
MDSAFAFSVDIPNDVRCVSSSYSRRKCQECGAFLLQEEGICPICNPMEFARVRDTTNFSFFQVEDSNQNYKETVIFFLFDLDCDIADLLSIANELIIDAEGDNSHNYQRILFNFGFLGSSTQLFKKDSQGIHFYTLTKHSDICQTAQPILNFKDYIFLAINIAKRYLSPATDKSQQLSSTYKILSEQDSNSNFISDMFYFFSGTLPQNLSCKSGTRSHFYHFASEPSKPNMECALQVSATYFFSSTVCNALFQNIIRNISCHGALQCKISIIASSGITFNNVVGPVTRVGSAYNCKVLDVSTYSRNLPLYLILKISKDAYQRNQAFSIQMLFFITPGIIYVVSEVWQKAKSNLEFFSSISNYLFEGYYVQKFCYDLFTKSSWRSKLPWSIPTRNSKVFKENNSLKYRLSILESFLNQLLGTDEILALNFRMYMFVHIFYGEPQYLKDLMMSLTDQAIGNEIIYLPPLILCKNKKSTAVSEIRPNLLQFTIIICDDGSFNSIKTIIENLQTKLKSYDPRTPI